MRKKNNPLRVWERLVGGTVSAIVKAWDEIPSTAKHKFKPSKLLYSQFISSS
jgi:hypothetical protein